jgi:hypothetical protein
VPYPAAARWSNQVATRRDEPTDEQIGELIMGRTAEWEISDFEADDEVAFIKIEPRVDETHRRAVHQERGHELTARKWRPFAVNAACAAVGAIATMLALGSPASVDSHRAGTADRRMPPAEQSAVSAAESSSTSTSFDEVAWLDAARSNVDPIQNAIWEVLFAPTAATDAFPDLSGLALAAYLASAQTETRVTP